MLHGNTETLVLALLAEEEQYGYQMRKELASRSHHYFQFAFGNCRNRHDVIDTSRTAGSDRRSEGCAGRNAIQISGGRIVGDQIAFLRLVRFASTSA